jgi:HSP20 family protein
MTMPHIKFDPMRELDYLGERMKRFAQEFPETFSFEVGKGFEPRVDIVHNADAVIVTAELPGMEKSDVRLTVSNGVLTISGEKTVPDRENMSEVRLERSFGPFSREIELPVEIDRNRVTAGMANGVLEIRLQKAASEQDNKINIEIL